jgi:hypothetical protein
MDDAREDLGRMKIQNWNKRATNRGAWKKMDKITVHPRTGHEGP